MIIHFSQQISKSTLAENANWWHFIERMSGSQEAMKLDSEGRREVDLVSRVMQEAKQFMRNHKPRVRRKLTLTIWDDGGLVNMLDIECKTSLSENFV